MSGLVPDLRTNWRELEESFERGRNHTVYQQIQSNPSQPIASHATAIAVVDIYGLPSPAQPSGLKHSNVQYLLLCQLTLLETSAVSLFRK